MTKLSIKKNFWVLAFSGLLAFLLLPTDSFAQSRKITKRGADDTYQATKKTRNRSIAKRDYSSRTRTTTPARRTPSRATAKRDYTTKTRATSNRSVGKRSTSKKARTAQTRARKATTYTNRRANRTTRNTNTRATNARTNQGNSTRYNGNRATRNTASNYTYRANERNDYCNNYYRGINNWNRTFWTSIHYTPAYYDLTYNRFPYSNGLRAQKVRFLGNRYWLYDGIWFKKRFGRYYAVDAPIGLCVDYLPLGGEMIWYRGDKYVIYRGTAYKMLPFGGFQVVQMLGRC